MDAHANTMTPTLDTRRMVLRPLELADAEQIKTLLPHCEIVRYVQSSTFLSSMKSGPGKSLRPWPPSRSRIPRSRTALETGIHSPWVSRQLTQLGHEVIVAHARNVRLIGESSRKDDQLDARTLARLARIDPALLGPVRHRSAQAQIHLTVIRARAALVSTRTALVNAARGLTKSYGERLPKCGTEQMNREIAKGLSQELRDVLAPLL